MFPERSSGPVCANFLSWLLVRPIFRDQWVLPLEREGFAHRLFRRYQARRMTIDLDGIAIDRPIFIISLPRSGSSMLQDLLCAHPAMAYLTNMMYMFPDCFCAAEHFRKKFHLDVRGERFLADSVEVGPGSPADPVATWAKWLGQDPYDLTYRERALADYTPAHVAAVHDDIKRVLWCFGGRDRRYFCKTPGLLPHIQLLKDLLPGARFIHLVRDARMNANSMIKLHRLCTEQWARIRKRRPREPDHPLFIPYPRLPGLADLIDRYGPEDLRTTAALWNEAMAFIEAARPKIPSEQFHEVRYEDLLARPHEELGRIFRFLELTEPDAACTDYHARLAAVGHVHHTNRYGGFEIVEEICRPTLERLGYL